MLQPDTGELLPPTPTPTPPSTSSLAALFVALMGDFQRQETAKARDTGISQRRRQRAGRNAAFAAAYIDVRTVTDVTGAGGA